MQTAVTKTVFSKTHFLEFAIMQGFTTTAVHLTRAFLSQDWSKPLDSQTPSITDPTAHRFNTELATTQLYQTIARALMAYGDVQSVDQLLGIAQSLGKPMDVFINVMGIWKLCLGFEDLNEWASSPPTDIDYYLISLYRPYVYQLGFHSAAYAMDRKLNQISQGYLPRYKTTGGAELLRFPENFYFREALDRQILDESAGFGIPSVFLDVNMVLKSPAGIDERG
ncbi:hypothetical protein H4R33_003739 [Dimargaris cristalligena]|nr:hypothetical protein H4R33_003739 [Dimargaris cristalligena]